MSSQQTGTIRGIVRYPWGTVKEATIVAGEKSVLSDEDGNYVITGLTQGPYVVTASAPFPGYEAQPQNAIVGGETTVVDIYLDFVKAIVEGHVYDSDDKPVVGVTISGVLCGMKAETTSTDEKGYFRFTQASPGSQFIRVNAPGHMAETRNFTASQQETVTLEFRLKSATCRIHGTVKDTDGHPLRAVVNLRSSAGIIVARTSSDAATGHYEFMVLPDSYGLLVEEAEHEWKGWSGAVSSETEVNFELRYD
jgi:hypothetical protein